jgi:hypothetical protein
VDLERHRDGLSALLLTGLPSVPARLPVGQDAGVPLALWVGQAWAAALWAWRVADTKPHVVPGLLGSLPAHDYEFELRLWHSQDRVWVDDFASGGEWPGDIDAPFEVIARPAAWGSTDPDYEPPSMPFWWGGLCGVIDGDSDVTVVPGIAAPEVARIDLRDASGRTTASITLRRQCGAVILATEHRPVFPVAVGWDGVDLMTPDGDAYINPENFDGWDEFTSPDQDNGIAS